jgi:hypothetical protein
LLSNPTLTSFERSVQVDSLVKQLEAAQAAALVAREAEGARRSEAEAEVEEGAVMRSSAAQRHADARAAMEEAAAVLQAAQAAGETGYSLERKAALVMGALRDVETAEEEMGEHLAEDDGWRRSTMPEAGAHAGAPLQRATFASVSHAADDEPIRIVLDVVESVEGSIRVELLCPVVQDSASRSVRRKLAFR